MGYLDRVSATMGAVSQTKGILLTLYSPSFMESGRVLLAHADRTQCAEFQ